MTQWRGEPVARIAMLDGPTHAPGFGRVEGHQPPSWPDEGGRKQFHLDPAGHPCCLTKAENWG